MSENIENNNTPDRLLDGCRKASSPEEQRLAWEDLANYVKNLRNDGGNTIVIKQHVARRLLLEWPYGQVSDSIDKVLDACGIFVAMSTCTNILKELAGLSSFSADTELPLPSILQACWSTIQRRFLSRRAKIVVAEIQSQIDSPNAKAELQQLVHVLLLIPQIISNACHAIRIKVPLLATPCKFYPRLVECSLNNDADGGPSDKNSYMQVLVQNLLQRRKGDHVAEGLAHSHPILLLSKFSLSPKETSSLLLAMLQLYTCTTTSPTQQSDPKVLETCLDLLRSCSLEHQEDFVQKVVFSVVNLDLTPTLVELLAGCGNLYLHLCQVAEIWSQWAFVQQTDRAQQRHVTQVLLYGLEELEDNKTNDSDELTMTLLHGVTHRLESFLSPIRRDGMRVAQKVAKRLGQELYFEELQESNQLDNARNEDESPPDVIEKTPIPKQNLPSNKPKRTKQKVKLPQLDPDADYFSDNGESDGDSECHSDISNEDSTVYEDELVPYDLEDTEEDLVETARPLHLLEALELLRVDENHDHAYSHHEVALQSLPDLIRKRPDDLPDVAISILLQLLRMENKFNIENFLELRHESILELTFQEPSTVGQQLIVETFRDGSLSDRLNCLAALQDAGYKLSGSEQVDERNRLRSKSPENVHTKTLVSSNDQVARVQSKTRQKRRRRVDPVPIQNKFTAVAPMWFYSLVASFLKFKDKDTLWTGTTGSQFLASFFQTLAAIVEFSGVQCSQVMAKDLLDLVWSFRDADVAEVRMSVLVAIATSVALLSEERVVSLVLEQGEKNLPITVSRISQDDPDCNCRSLALSISRSLMEIVGSMQSPFL